MLEREAQLCFAPMGFKLITVLYNSDKPLQVTWLSTLSCVSFAAAFKLFFFLLPVWIGFQKVSQISSYALKFILKFQYGYSTSV